VSGASEAALVAETGVNTLSIIALRIVLQRAVIPWRFRQWGLLRANWWY